MERACLLEDLLGRFRVGDICPDETTVVRKPLAELRTIDPDHAPAFRSKVMHSCASDPPSRAGDENSFCHRSRIPYIYNIRHTGTPWHRPDGAVCARCKCCEQSRCISPCEAKQSLTKLTYGNKLRDCFVATPQRHSSQ